MTIKTSLFTAAALSTLALSAHAQTTTGGTLMIPGMVPGTRPGFVRPAADAMPTDNTMPASSRQNGMTQNGMMQNGMTPDPMMMQNGMQPGMMQPGMMSAQDKLFGARAAEGNLAEITFATLALNKTKNPNVRQTAQVILTGHTKAQNDLMQLMRSKNMMMMPMLSATHMVVYDALRKAKDDQFDKMYMAGQTSDHENTIALFQVETSAGMDDALKGYAGQYLPDIVGHTILIYNVARQVKAPGSEVRPMLPPVPPGVTPALMGKPIDMTDMNSINMSMNQMIMDMNGQMMTR